MSTSKNISSPVELTPSATSYQADDDDDDDDDETSLHTPESDSDSGSGFAGEQGYELRSLSRSGRVGSGGGGGGAGHDGASEHGALIAPGPDSDDDEGDVVYDAFRESDEEDSAQLRRRRRLRGRRKEFLYTREEEKKVIRKFDFNLVGFLALLYMLSFLDRSSTFLGPLSLSLCSGG